MVSTAAEHAGRRPTAPALRGCALVLSVLSLAGPSPVNAETIDPGGDGSQHAWSENAGWINAEPAGNGGPGMDITTNGVKGWLWSENLGWISLSCENTASCATVEYRAHRDPSGELSGFAWSENAGWISLSCQNTSSCATIDYRVTIDPGTGELVGYAWSENVGWLVLSCTTTASCATVDYGVRTTVPLPDPIFTDGFESGSTFWWNIALP